MERFSYENAVTVADAVSMLKAENVSVLAGGTDILNLMKKNANAAAKATNSRYMNSSPPPLLIRSRQSE